VGNVKWAAGAVVSTQTAVLFGLSVPDQLVPWTGVTVYCQRPSGALGSVQVRPVMVPEQVPLTARATPVAEL
jgi:hypothetical protein